jgi:capsular polysaccharide transport system permease protein
VLKKPRTHLALQQIPGPLRQMTDTFPNSEGALAGLPSLPAGKPQAKSKRRSFASLRSIAALVLREMATTYGRSPGGYLWAILEPTAGIALLSAIFSFGFRNPAIGTNFALFYATGLVPLVFFTAISSRVALSVIYSRQLLAYPSVTFLDAILARFVLNVLTQVLVAYVIFSGILLIFDVKVILNFPAIAASLALSCALALGIGTLNCFLFTKFPVWQQFWSIVTRPLFLISCVFMLFDQIPVWARDWLWYNPIIHTVGMMRHGFYSTYHASYVSAAYVMGVSLVCGTVGLLLLYRHKYDLLER